MVSARPGSTWNRTWPKLVVQILVDLPDVFQPDRIDPHEPILVAI